MRTILHSIGRFIPAGVATVVAVTVAATDALAQQPAAGRIMAGPTAGFQTGSSSSDVPVYEGSPECGVFDAGGSSTPSLGLSIRLPALFSDDLGISVDAQTSRSSIELRGLPTQPVPIYDPETGRKVNLQREFRLATTAWKAGLDILVSYRLGRSLVVGLGPSIGVQLSTSARQTDHALGPGAYSFPDGQTEAPMWGGERIGSQVLQVAGLARVGYALPVGGSTLLLPELELGADLTSRFAGFSARSLSIGGRISLLFDVTPGAAPEIAGAILPPPSEPPALREDAPREDAPRRTPKPSRLAADVELFGIDEEEQRLPVAKVMVREVLYRQHAPLLPAVYFDRDSTALASRYVRLSSAAADTFLMEDLSGLDLLGIQHQVLNVVGARMRRQRTSRLTLVPSTSGEEPVSRGRERAGAIAGYLTDVWGIDPGRIAIRERPGGMRRSSETTEDGREDNRRVEMIATPPSLLNQVVTDEVVRDFNPPMIKMNPHFEAEAGVRAWTLTVTQGSWEVARYSSRDTAGLARELVWNIARDRIDSGLSPLVATLTVEDSTGASAVARAEVPLVLDRTTRVIDKRIEVRGDRERIEFGLVAFDYNMAVLERAHEAEIRAIARAIRDGAAVTVTGFTDRVGDERYNVELSNQRAERVATALRTLVDALRLSDVEIRWSGAGVEKDRFDNSLPEGRGLSRGVSVVVEQDLPGLLEDGE